MNDGPPSPACIREQRELANHQAEPPTSDSERFVKPSASAKTRRPADLRRQAGGYPIVVRRSHAQQHSSPDPIEATDSPSIGRPPWRLAAAAHASVPSRLSGLAADQADGAPPQPAQHRQPWDHVETRSANRRTSHARPCRRRQSGPAPPPPLPGPPAPNEPAGLSAAGRNVAGIFRLHAGFDLLVGHSA